MTRARPGLQVQREGQGGQGEEEHAADGGHGAVVMVGGDGAAGVGTEGGAAWGRGAEGQGREMQGGGEGGGGVWSRPVPWLLVGVRKQAERRRVVPLATVLTQESSRQGTPLLRKP